MKKLLFALIAYTLISVCADHANLVSSELPSHGSASEWHQAGKWYINTHSSTAQKAPYIERIAEGLGVEMKVEVMLAHNR